VDVLDKAAAMDIEMKAGVHGRLARREIAVLRSLIVNKPQMRRAPGILGQLARERGIGSTNPREPGYIFYSEADFERAAAVLEADGLVPGTSSLPRGAKPYLPRVEAACVAATTINMGAFGPVHWP
jgi:hypothetical protein